ncbi:MAG TPA: transcriptional repressor NrdR [Candidatus Aenigmarchaeota archaeon]|nr:MAG: transcriptional regulator NrdR [Candidatus Aenigmarchaeota archaeon]HDD46094.1 transcriptional repressor NrdR [Candidatus Aenigmarchaeota archaeon]
MLCPYCNNKETRVVDKRETGDGKVIRRRRECLACGKRFTTYERIELSPVIVIKKDGRRERFDRNKLKIGILKACEKRPISEEQIDSLINNIEMEIRSNGNTEVESRVIGELVMENLRKLDEVAYIRFASVYRQFADIKSFQNELRRLLKEGKGGV